MKKSFIPVVFLLLSFLNSKAQDTETVTTTTTVRTITNTYDGLGFSNADLFISGGFNYKKSSYGDENLDNIFKINTKLGGFISEHFSLGIMLAYENQKTYDTDYNLPDEVSTFEIGLFSRYYFQTKNRFSIFLEASVSYLDVLVNFNNASYYDYSSGPKEIGFQGIGILFSPGFNYFLNKHFALEANWGLIKYNTIKSEEEDSESNKTIEIGSSFSDMSIGLLYKF